MSNYKVFVCPVCGKQPCRGWPDEMFGRLDCDEHGEVEPWEIEVHAVRTLPPQVARIRLGDGSKIWVIGSGTGHHEPPLEMIDRSVEAMPV